MIGMTGRRYLRILALKMTTGITTLTVLRELHYLVDTVSVASKSLWEKALKMGKSHTHVFEAPVGGDPQRFETENLDTTIIESQYDLRNPVIS